MKHRLRWSPGSLSVFSLLFCASLASIDSGALYACQCLAPPPAPLIALVESDHVFHGTAVTVDASQPGSHLVTFDVHAVWKGATAPTLMVRTASSSAACGVNFVVGNEYVVYAADSNGGGPLGTNSCTRTRLYTPEEGNALGNPIAVFPGGPPCEPTFRRGDSNTDGTVDITDGVVSLAALFQGGGLPSCMDAADSNDDGVMDIADPISIFQYLFVGGNLPPAPGPNDCGADPTDDVLDCQSYDSCPGGAEPGEVCEDGDCCPPGYYCAKALGDCDSAGVCTAIPEVCTRELNPVCGCDGETYSNPCMAAAAGANIARMGSCEDPVPGGCTSNDDCEIGYFCFTEDGECDAVGECVERPEFCVALFDPVCGCDGVTYSNSCVAASRGASVDHVGECEDDPGPAEGCGGNLDCPRGAYCRTEEGDCDAVGECTVRPTRCPRIFDPVCGCDGQTYPNACEAGRVGISVDHVGECGDKPEPGDCADNSDCGRGSYCAKAEGDCDGVGSCEVRPQACTREFRPVCGCDGETYSNACVAASQGATIDYLGECEDPPEEGCRSNRDCDAISYCAKDQGACDSVGVCRVRPQVCPLNFDPVCGCDGQTYGNACAAAGAGVNVAARGNCPNGPARPEPVPPREPAGPAINPRE